MHYVLVSLVITLYIYFRYGRKPLGYIFACLTAFVMMRGLVVMALPLAIISYFLLRQQKFLLKSPIDIRRSGQGTTAQYAGSAKISSKFITLTLSTDDGSMIGEITRGPLQAQSLERLSLKDYTQLLNHYNATDKDSEQLLMAYLDHGYKGWREELMLDPEFRSTTTGGSAPLSTNQALSILGLAANVKEQEIKYAHRQLMKKFHPDQGGSPFIAAKINMAKDKLLNHK